MTDIAALVERLRWVKDWCHVSTAKEAADALESLQAENERLGFYGGRTSVEAANEIAALTARAEKAEAERDDWRRIALERDQP